MKIILFNFLMLIRINHPEYIFLLIYYIIGETLMYLLLIKGLDNNKLNGANYFIYWIGTLLGAFFWPVVTPIIYLLKKMD